MSNTSWKRTRIKYLSHIEMGQSPPSYLYSLNPEAGLPFLQGCASFGETNPLPSEYCSAPNKTALSGDLLMSVRAPVGSLNFADQDYGIGRGLCAIRPRNVQSRFLWWALHHHRESLSLVSTGSTYEAVSAEDVGNIFINHPLYSEQKVIAEYLDSETGRIDALIATKERLLGLLAEKRRALITRAVTRGINPNAPLHDSGLPWLGQIPKHWEVKRLKYIATINDEALPENTPSDYEMQYVDISNVDSYGNIHEIAIYRFDDAPSRARRIVRNGDVIISTVRTYLQAIAPIENPLDNLIVSTGFAVIRPKSDIFYKGFCKFALRESNFLAEVEKRSVGVSYPAINASDLGDIFIHCPPLKEQYKIADYIENEMSKLDKLREAADKTISLLKERLAALISAAVTGKLKINNRSVL